MKRTLCLLALNCYLGFCFHLNQTFAQMPGPPIIDTPLTTSKTYFYNGEIIVPYSNGHVNVTNNAAVNILSTTEVTLLPGFTASVDSGCVEFLAGVGECPVISINSNKNNVSCAGGTDGSIIVTAEGGTPPYLYSWSPKQGATRAMYNLYAGTYTVIATDNSGCSATSQFQISEPPILISNITTTKSVCHQSNGAAFISTTGGSGNYSYLWSRNGENTPWLNDLSAGTYSISVFDTNGCSNKINVYISDSNASVPSNSITSEIKCFGGNDGSVLFTLPLGYPEPVWPECGLPEKLSAGTYQVQTVDSIGCIFYSEIIINQPEPIEIEFEITKSTCGNFNGSVLAKVTGGTGTYLYSWSSGDADSLLINRKSMQDTLIVTDENGCVNSRIVQLDDEDGPDISVTTTSASCTDFPNGALTIIAENGTAPFTYFGPHGFSNINSINGLNAGIYNVFVIDANGCKSSKQATVLQPEPINVTFDLNRPAFDSTKDGEIMLYCIGGTTPYSYNWEFGGFSSEVKNLLSGNYKVTITDFNNCSISTTIKLTPRSAVKSSCADNVPYDQMAIDNLMTQCQCDPTSHYPNLDLVRDFGANGTDSQSDEIAFEAANSFIQSTNNCTTEVTLTIPYGIYYVGRQVLGSSIPLNPYNLSHFQYLAGRDVFCFDHCKNISIIGVPDQTTGELPKIIFQPCLKYGYFDPVSGNRLVPCPSDSCIFSPTYGRTHYSATPGSFIFLIHSRFILLKNLDVNGSNDYLSIGGGSFISTYQNIQLGADGIDINHSDSIQIINSNFHNFGRDGISIFSEGSPHANYRAKVYLWNSKFNWNCRMGFSWTQGKEVHAYHTEFNYNGFGTFGGSPMRAGVDLEYEGGPYMGHGAFAYCDFLYNSATGLQSNSDPRGEDYSFYKCTFIGNSNGYSHNPAAKKMKFNCCNFYGESANYYDSYWTGGILNDDNLEFRFCNFNEEFTDPITNSVKAITSYSNGNCTGSTDHPPLISTFASSRVSFLNCTIRTGFYNKWGSFIGRTPEENYIKFQNTSFINTGMDQSDASNYKLAYFTKSDFLRNGNSTYTPSSTSAIGCSCNHPVSAPHFFGPFKSRIS